MNNAPDVPTLPSNRRSLSNIPTAEEREYTVYRMVRCICFRPCLKYVVHWYRHTAKKHTIELTYTSDNTSWRSTGDAHNPKKVADPKNVKLDEATGTRQIWNDPHFRDKKIKNNPYNAATDSRSKHINRKTRHNVHNHDSLRQNRPSFIPEFFPTACARKIKNKMKVHIRRTNHDYMRNIKHSAIQ